MKTTRATQKPVVSPRAVGLSTRSKDFVATGTVNESGQPKSAIADPLLIKYKRSEGVWNFVSKIREAGPWELVEVERRGVSAVLIPDLARQLGIPVLRLYSIVRVPKAAGKDKRAENRVVDGAGGQSAIGIVRLLGIAQSIVDKSMSPGESAIDAAKWLGEWIEQPLPALGWRKPADLLDTPTGINLVARVLGAIKGGTYL